MTRENQKISRRKLLVTLGTAGIGIAGSSLLGRSSLAYATASNDWYNVKVDYSAAGDGITDDMAAIQSAINAANAAGGGTVYFPEGTYLVSGSLTLYSNINLIGAGYQSVIKSTMAGTNYVMIGIRVSNINIEKMHFSSTNSSLTAIKVSTSSNIRVANNIVTVMALILSNTTASSYANVTPADYSNNIQVIGNVCEGAAPAPLECINFSYSTACLANGNIIKGYRHGIMWWGGDSNPQRNGAIANERKAKNIVVSNNIITNISDGGIWGSMGERVTIGNNEVTDCGDVGIDVEGTDYAAISGNVVRNCANGGITTFFFCKGINISANTVYSNADGQYLVKIYNSSQTSDNKDISISCNTFHNNGPGLSYIGGDAAEKILIANNYMLNTCINTWANNCRYTTIEGNNLVFENAASTAINAINAGNTNNSGKLIVQNNFITSNAVQPAGSRGVYTKQADYNSTSYTLISGNTIFGFGIDIEVLANSGNSGVIPKFVVKDNCLGSGKFVRSEGSAQKSSVRLEGNYLSSGKSYPSGIPVSGKWDAGQIVYYDIPAAGGYVGAVCVEQGTPGVWKEFGVIAN